MSWFKTAEQLIHPPHCVGCGQKLRASFGGYTAPLLCAECATAWERSTLAQCPQCFRAYRDCTCAPYAVTRAGGAALIKMAPYTEESELRVVRGVLLGIKKRPSRRGMQFCADALCEGTEKALREAEENMPISHTVVAHLPRSRRNARLYGFDQSKGVAQRLARHLGLKYTSLLRRVHDGTEQKRLGVAARRKNVKGAFALRGSVKGLRVILVDDIVTTGAGMAEAVRTLRRGGAAQILCVAVAATPKEKRSERKIP
jgi:ComF family protein